MTEKKEKTVRADEEKEAVDKDLAAGKEKEEVPEADKKTAQKKEEKKDEKESQLEELGLKLVEMNDKYLRLSAEFDNYRKRTLKEKMELMKNAGEEILIRILPVVDNFERALASMEKSNDIEAIRKGVELIYSNFKDFLTQNGVKEIPCTNSDFDTDVHEAVTKIPAPTEELKGKVVDCIQKGYMLNDKVVRFAKVVVGE